MTQRAPIINLVPATVDLAMYAGDGANFHIRLKDDFGEPFPIEGDVIGQVKMARVDVASLADFAVDMTDAAEGNIILTLTGVQTASLLAGGVKFEGVWDVQWTEPGGEPTTLMQGKATCEIDVTRPVG